MASWLGYATTTWTHSPSSISLPLKGSTSSAPNGTSTLYSSSNPTANDRTLADLCKASTPPCVLSPLLPGGHLQTIYAAVYKKPIALLHYKRRIFTSDSSQYPGCFAVDFVSRSPAAEDVATVNPRTTMFDEADWERYQSTGCVDADAQVEEVDQRPIIVALHGISGGSHELYLRQVLDPLVTGAPTSRGGETGPAWDAVVVNARGCANAPVTSSKLFNARATWDVKQFLDWLHERFPHRKLFGVGFSLGANILINYLGEQGSDTPLSAAAVASNPWNLDRSSAALLRSYIGREVYLKALTVNMKKVFEKHVDKISENPDIDVEKVRATKYLAEFDTEIQCPTWGYPTVGAYYRDASSVDTLFNIRVPVLGVNAEDDPIAPKECLPYREVTANPYLVLCTTDMGGHLSWFESGGGRWFVKPIVNFLRNLAREVDLDALPTVEAKVPRPYGMRGQAGEAVFDPLRRKLQAS